MQKSQVRKVVAAPARGRLLARVLAEDLRAVKGKEGQETLEWLVVTKNGGGDLSDPGMEVDRPAF